MVLSEQDLADIQTIAEDRFNLGLNPHSTLKLLRAYKALRATQCTRAERAVLDAMAAVPWEGQDPARIEAAMLPVVMAELARRGAKP